MQPDIDSSKKVSDDAELAEFIRYLENLGYSDLIEHVTKE